MPKEHIETSTTGAVRVVVPVFSVRLQEALALKPPQISARLALAPSELARQAAHGREAGAVFASEPRQACKCLLLSMGQAPVSRNRLRETPKGALEQTVRNERLANLWFLASRGRRRAAHWAPPLLVCAVLRVLLALLGRS